MTHGPDGKVEERAIMIGWAIGNYHGPVGPVIGVLTRLTGLRETNFNQKTMNLVTNPIPELKNLRTGSIAIEKSVALSSIPHSVEGSQQLQVQH